MSTKYEPEQFDLRISGQKSEEPSVDVETLTHVLQGMQKAVLVLVKDALGLPASKPLPPKVEKAFSIRCSIPKHGSYVMPVEFGFTETTLFEDSPSVDPRCIADKLFNCLSALNVCQDGAFSGISDMGNRKHLLLACRSMLPKSGAYRRLGISRPKNSLEIPLTSKTSLFIKKIQERVLTKDEYSLQTVTGHLIQMDFEKHYITLKYPVTKTDLKCYYTNELEDELFENRRELLQVTGNVTYERDKETPKKIADVESFQFLDMSEFVLESFCIDGNEIEFKEPLILVPALTESCQFITLQDMRFGIDVIAQTRDELEEELDAELKMLWEQSQQSDTKLGKTFQEQKRNFLAVIKEI
jgi:hypothetical protein